MKGYELIQKIANREIKQDSKIKVSISNKQMDIIEYKNGRLEWEPNGKFNTEYLCKNTVEFEVIEENKEIEELISDEEFTREPFEVVGHLEYKPNIRKMHDKINELVRAVNKLIKESEEK